MYCILIMEQPDTEKEIKELQEKEEEILEISKENNKLLRKLHKSMVLSRIFRGLYWFFVIGLAFGLYFYIQPFIDGLPDAYKNFFERFGSVSDFTPTDTP